MEHPPTTQDPVKQDPVKQDPVKQDPVKPAGAVTPQGIPTGGVPMVEPAAANYVPIKTAAERSLEDMLGKAPTIDDSMAELGDRAFGPDSGGVTSGLIRAIRRKHYKPDPSYRLTPELERRLNANLPLEFHDKILGSVSLEEATDRVAEITRIMKNEIALSKYGLYGYTARIVADMTDPVFLVSMSLGGIAVRPIAAAVAWRTRGKSAQALVNEYIAGKRVSMAKLFPDGKIPLGVAHELQDEAVAIVHKELASSYAARAITGGASFGAAETARAIVDPTKDEDNVLHAVVSGALVSVGHLALTKNMIRLRGGAARLRSRWDAGEFENSMSVRRAPRPNDIRPPGIGAGATPLPMPTNSRLGPGATPMGSNPDWASAIRLGPGAPAPTPAIRLGPGSSPTLGTIELGPGTSPDVIALVPKEELALVQQGFNASAPVNTEPAELGTPMTELRVRARELGVTPSRSAVGTVERINAELSKRNTFGVTQSVIDANPYLAAAENVVAAGSPEGFSFSQLAYDDVEVAILQPKYGRMWTGWYQMGDINYKAQVATAIESDPNLKNAGMSMFYKQWREFAENSSMSFEEFLTSDVTMYRAGGTAEGAFASYSLDPKIAGAHQTAGIGGAGARGGDIDTISVRPQDTLGMYNNTAELEVFVPTTTDFVPVRPTPAEKAAQLKNAPVPGALKIADELRLAKGMPEPPPAVTKATFDTDNAMRIAEEYELMRNDPTNPQVMEAYEALGTELIEQYEAIVADGYSMELFSEGFEPYKSSAHMLEDLRNGKNMLVFSTEEGFGGGITEQMRLENPMLKDSGLRDVNGKVILVNDMFRFVHDFLGHGEKGNSFGPIGEETAWQVHSSLFSPKARRALTTETRGQNSWVNFNPKNINADGTVKVKGDEGFVPASERPFADQKIGLMPEWTSVLPGESTTAPAAGGAAAPLESLPEVDVMARVKGVFEGRGSRGTVLTAANPGKTLTDAENEPLMEALRKELDEAGIVYSEGSGHYFGDEPTIFIESLTEAESVYLGVKFGQESVLTPNGLLHTTGKGVGFMNPSTRKVLPRAGEKESYTKLKTADGELQFMVDIPTAGEHPTVPYDMAKLLKKGERAFQKRKDALKPPPPEPLVAVAGEPTTAMATAAAPAAGGAAAPPQAPVPREQFMENLRATTPVLDMPGVRGVMPGMHVSGMMHPDKMVNWLTWKVHQSLVALRDPVTGKLVANDFTSVTAAEQGLKTLMNPMARVYKDAFSRWTYGEGIFFGSERGMNSRGAKAFDGMVAQDIRGLYKGNNADVLEAAQAIRDVITAANESLVGKFTDKPFDEPNYLPRSYSLPTVIDSINKYGYAEMELFFIEAISRANPDLSPAANRYKGKLLLRDLYQRTFKVDYQSKGLHNGDSRLETKAKLEALGAPPDVIEELLNDFFPPSTGPVRSLKPRTKMDEGYTRKMATANGELVELSMDSMFKGGAFFNVFNHVRGIQGALQLHKIGLEFNQLRGITDGTAATEAEMWAYMEETAIASQTNTKDLKEHFQLAMDMTMGRPLYDSGTKLAQYAKVARAIASITIGGTFGIAALAEVFMPAAHTSIASFVKQFPGLGQMWSIIRSGNALPQTLQDELQLLSPTGANRLMSQVSALHEAALDEAGSQGSLQDKLNLGQQATYIASLMIPITDLFRGMSNASLAQLVWDQSLVAGVPYSDTRLSQYGLDRDMWLQIGQQMKLWGEVDAKGRLQAANFDKWDNTAAVAAYTKMQLFHTNRAVHEVMAGQVPRKTMGPIGLVLTQFLRFPMTAVDSQLMTGLQEKDQRAAFAFLSNLMGGALSYTAYIYHRYGDDPEKLEEYLTVEEIAKGAFKRSGFSTVMPFIIDTGRDLYGLSPMFSHGSAVGLSTDIWGGTPTASIFKSMGGTAKATFASLLNTDYEFSEEDWRNVRNLIPLQNSMWLHRTLSKVPKWLDLPKESKEK